ncbi:MAG TPA: DUF6279 family lipoprotein [Burkholderiaceae bacterium]
MAQLAACSAIKLTYNNADTLAYWWLNGYIDIASEQKGLVRTEIGGYLQWHRQSQLPEYARLLREGQKRIAGNPTKADFLADFDLARKQGEIALLQAAPALADIALSMRPQQLARLEKKFASNNDDFRKKHMRGDLEKRLKNRYKRSLEQYEFWFGRFSREQEEQIRRASDARPMEEELVLAGRMERQARIVAMVRKFMQERPPREQVVATITQFAQEASAPPRDPAQRAYYDSFLNGTAALTETVVRIATPEQKAHAQRKLQELIDFCNEMSARKRT